jgi:hypothetical protein
MPYSNLTFLTVGVALAFSVAAHPQRGSAEEAGHIVIAADAIE